MTQPNVTAAGPAAVVKAWQREPGTVVEIAIGRTLSLEGLEQLAYLVRSTVLLLLDLNIVKDA